MQKNGFIVHLLVITLIVLIVLSFLGLFSFTNMWAKFKNTGIGSWLAPILEALWNNILKPIWDSIQRLLMAIWGVIRGWFGSDLKNNLPKPSIGVGVNVNLFPSPTPKK